MRDLYCYECYLQFDIKHVFDVHLSVVHGENLDIKQEPDSQPLVIPEAKELEIRQTDEENTLKNESKRRKVSMKTASGHKEKENFQCDLCHANFGKKGNLNSHVETVHEGKKQYKCEICDTKFKSKYGMKGHIARIHEGMKTNQN